MRKLLLLHFITLCVACNMNRSSLVCGENKSNISLYFQLGSGLVCNNICPDVLLSNKPYGHVINPSEQIVIINMDATNGRLILKEEEIQHVYLLWREIHFLNMTGRMYVKIIVFLNDMI